MSLLAKNAVALVTGAASGLGKATAQQIVKNGGRVVIMDLNSSLGDAVSTELGDNAVFAKTDVTSESDVLAAIDMAEEKFGEPINAAINCAGIGTACRTVSRKGPHALDSFVNTLTVNTVGTFNVIRLAAARMSSADPFGPDNARGVIINTASVAAFDGQVGQVAYSASKGAICGMTLPIARDLSLSGIRCVTIAPGLMKTPLLEGLPAKVQAELGASVPFPNRLGEPSEFGSFVVSILENAMLNGEVIRLDGSIRMPP